MQCGKSCIRLILLSLILLVAGFYLIKKLIHPFDDSPVVTKVDQITANQPYPPIPQPLGNLDKALIVNTDPSTNCGPRELTFSESKLLELPQHTFTTLHTWSTVPQEFSGPLLADVIKLVCPNAREVYLRSLDQYSIMFNFQKLAKYQPILALKIDGKFLSIREKGPIWLMVDTNGYKLPARSLDTLLVWQLYYIRILTSD